MARIPEDARLLATAGDIPLIVMVSEEAPEDNVAMFRDKGAEVIEMPQRPGGGLDTVTVLATLAEKGFTRVFAEGGSKVAANLVRDDLLDEVVIFRAPVVVGPDGVRALDGMAMSAIERSPRYRLVQVGEVGDDEMRVYTRAV